MVGNSLKNSILSIIAGSAMSYLAARAANDQTSWTPYRNQMIEAMAAAAMNTAMQQLPKD